ncbi:MAG: hypothetical protein K9I94_06700 [Bacteroidales bacterium]|nr:hypothetical protein [Bacteroidales bacterium]
MQKLKNISILFILAGLTLFPSYLKGQDVIRPAQERFNKFTKVDDGWCAADVTISLPLPGDKTLWLFGDTFIGEMEGEFNIKNGASTMIRNSVIIEDNDELTTYYGGTLENPTSFIPEQGEAWFWPEHAILEEDTLRIFAFRVWKGEGNPNFQFKVGGTHIASFSYPAMEHLHTKPLEAVLDTNMRFGTCVLEQEDYTYVFGKKDTTQNTWTWLLPYLARVENSVMGDWEFYAGNDQWSEHSEDAVPIGDRPISESLSVHEQNGSFYLVQHEIWLDSKLIIQKSDKITGPWNTSNTGGIENVFADIVVPDENFTYNAFAHPQFTDNGEILISFNVNADDFFSIFDDTRNYRGRFYWLDVEEAVNTTQPGTAHIFDDFPGTSAIDGSPDHGKEHFKFIQGALKIRNLNKKALLNIYGIDGRKYLSKTVTNGDRVDLKKLTGNIVLIQLITEKGVVTQKNYVN